ncbi:FYN-binding protein 1-like isoform X2 [Brienomyrus brachyistius]|uniref:FYN-binding protein 1-like isoform X2 n=1 Tax=Brienomyrus brachyistius TaxID=42636 RepID=UPI0020B38A81|nr:FYN-binding protein 1-like isoform X2 [Brienomyrus brachyistius]
MDAKPDVKAIMARFNAPNNGSTEAATGGHPTLHHTFSSGGSSQLKRTSLESTLSGNTTGLKTNTRRNTDSSQSTPETHEFPRPKVPPAKPGGGSEDGKPTFPKPHAFKPKTSETAMDGEPKPTPPKLISQKPALTATLSDPKTSTPKPPPALTKPPWKDSAKPEDSSSSPAPAKPVPANKPKSTLGVMRSHAEDTSTPDSGSKPHPLSNLKPTGFRAAQNTFNKENTEEAPREGPRPQNSNDAPGPKSPAAKKPSFVRKIQAQASQKEISDPNAPKKNPLPNIFALGTPPAKPNRPPKVSLEKFKKGGEPISEGLKKTVGRPQPPAFHPSSNVPPPVPALSAAPSLPPRPGNMSQSEPDEYDDVGGHPNQKHEGSDNDETYEDPDSRRSPSEEKRQEKGDKRKVELEKKEQKEREKKEQEMRKKFKITGPVQVIHRGKARVDCKGGKMDLSVKQGDPIEIIRITDNPEGRWLGRTREGSYGYIKTESVAIDFDTLKRHGGAMINQPNVDQELYDDVGSQDSRVVKGPGGEDGEIYDDLDDPDLNISLQESKISPKARNLLSVFKGWDDWRRGTARSNQVPPPPQFTPEENAASSVDEVYDDVDAPIASHTAKPKGKVEDKDPRKQKKFDKEEKEFRKKFKFEGEVQVLDHVTVLASLSGKKWGAKELVLKPGDTLDVIVKAVDGKLICRNEEGKFGYVSTSNVDMGDSDIYDDIGDDCIYDND